VLVRPTQHLFAAAAGLALVSPALAWGWIEDPPSHLSPGEIRLLLRNVTAPMTGVRRRLFNPTVELAVPPPRGGQRRAWAYLDAIAFVGTTSDFVLFRLYLAGVGVSPATILGSSC